MPVAYVVPGPAGTPEPDELRAHVREHLAAFTVPAAVTIMENLPKTPTDKIHKRGLRDLET